MQGKDDGVQVSKKKKKNREGRSFGRGGALEGLTIHRSTKFKTFPDLLVLHMKKFQLVNWLPTKLDIPVSVPDILTLDHLVAQGLQPGEQELTVSSSSPSLPEFNATAMAQLEAMGFPTVRCQKALLATGNNDAEIAMGWLFEHMEDPGELSLSLVHGKIRSSKYH